MLRAFVTSLVIAVTPMAVSAAEGTEVYDLLFKDGTLDEVDRAKALTYRREVLNALKPDAAERDTGDISLWFPEGEEALARLTFRQNGKKKSLGVFPSSVGNPMIMYFYETVVRDMAESAGGSPFYIRNRVKEALISPADIQTGTAMRNGQEIATQVVRMFPFAGDPNIERMQGFGDLELTVTMSDAVPGWYVSLVAVAGEAAAPIYRSELNFDHLGDVE